MHNFNKRLDFILHLIISCVHLAFNIKSQFYITAKQNKITRFWWLLRLIADCKPNRKPQKTGGKVRLMSDSTGLK